MKVGDFGVAGLAEGSSGGVSQTIVGTPSYMAPEQSRGRPVSPATDVYSAGVVLYEMVGGSRPFRADSAVELALCHLQDSPPPLPTSVPEPLRQIIARALAKDPSQRYADGGEMADALVDASRRAGERARERAGRSAGRAATPRPTRRATGRGATERRATERRATERIASTAVMATAGTATAGTASAGTASAGTATAGTATLTPPAPPPERPRRAAATTPPRRPTPPATANGPDGTRPAPLVSRRSEHNPPARRRAIAALLGAFALVGAMVAAAILVGSGGSGASKRHVVPKIEVPNVTGLSTATAEARLKRSHLHARVVTVPWPGHAAGTVRSQSPVARRVKRRSTVTLSVAEVPTWKTVGQFSSTTSPVYLIQGSKFRLVYSVQNEKSCTLWVFCSRSSVTVTNTASGSQVDQFDLSDGSGERQVFATGRGSYQVRVDPASGDARWSFAVQDWY